MKQFIQELIKILRRVNMYHNPVLLAESIEGLAIQPDGIYVDATFGGGGHAQKILDALNDEGKLFAFDQDPDSSRNAIDDPRFMLISANFAHISRFLQYYQAFPVNGILADLGVSSYQFDTSARGFSYRSDGELDMRMNTHAGVTAKEVVNNYTIEQLSDIFYQYGELKNGKRIASLIAEEREKKLIQSTFDLVIAVKPVLHPRSENKTLSQIFQAIRIEVNQELKVLQSFLLSTLLALHPGGRLVIISYHSLEDRMVKNFMKAGNLEGIIEKDFFGNVLTPFQLINNRVITPTEEEISLNGRARSAKLRIAEKK